MSEQNFDQKPFPKESIDGDAHTLRMSDVEYDVYKLIDLTKEIAPTNFDPSKLEEKVLEEKCWRDSRGENFSPNDVLDAFRKYDSWDRVLETYPEWDEHIKKIISADYSYPILMHKDEMLDGMHRLIKAITDRAGSIPVRVFEEIPKEAIFNSEV